MGKIKIINLFNFIIFVLLVGCIFSIYILMFKSCDAYGEENVEWRCEAIPPAEIKNMFEIVGIDEDKQVAEKLALDFCNKLFKIDKCKIKKCERRKIK